MPSKQFISAVDLLDSSVAKVVIDLLKVWQAQPVDSPWPQVARNIENETALKPARFSQILSEFAAALDLSPASEAWKSVCWKNQFAGRKLKSGETPKILGRMMKLDEMVKRLSVLGVAMSVIEDIIFDADGVDLANIDPALSDMIRCVSLGKYVIWATFDEAHPTHDSFDSFPDSAADCCTILGLPDTAGASWILLHYNSYEDLPASGFHRPTVADAADFPLFRPNPKSSAIYGRTHPTPPNSKGFSGSPEIMHGEITGKGLIFPYRLVV